MNALLLALVLMAATPARAQLGMTLSQVKTAWGEPLSTPWINSDGLGMASFYKEPWTINVTTKADRILFVEYFSDGPEDDKAAAAVLTANGGHWRRVDECESKDDKGNKARVENDAGQKALYFWSKEMLALFGE